MEEREKQLVSIINYRNNVIFAGLIYYKGVRAALHRAAYDSEERYVDTLTDKQREALTFIRMMPKGEFVEGVGAWVAKSNGRKVYIIDC